MDTYNVIEKSSVIYLQEQIHRNWEIFRDKFVCLFVCFVALHLQRDIFKATYNVIGKSSAISSGTHTM